MKSQWYWTGVWFVYSGAIISMALKIRELTGG